jgi:aminoglycoside phosphotransferase (APT) family kinase protein
MGREYKLIAALWPTPVPVPEPLAHCTDLAVTGASFYAMGQVRGRSLYTIDDVDALVPYERRHALGMHFIEVLADLHSLDPASVGLADLGKPDAYVARQVKRWYQSWEASKTAERPEVDALHEWLAANVPEQGPGRVVHGDYGLHNCISSPEGRIAAVVDWEISTLGDPLADLAYALNAWLEPEDPLPPRPTSPLLAGGFPRRAELLARYAERTGRDVSGIDFYAAFNHWKTVCIVEGVYARYLKGQKSTDGVDLEALCLSRDRSLALAVERARTLGFSA